MTRHHVSVNAAGHFEVLSSDSGKTYEVKLALTCSCPAGLHGVPCKHLGAVSDYVLANKPAAGPTAVNPAQPSQAHPSAPAASAVPSDAAPQGSASRGGARELFARVDGEERARRDLQVGR